MSVAAQVQALARAAAASSWDTAPPAVRDRVVDLVADWVAVTALGSAREELRRFADAAGTTAPLGLSTVVGSPRGWAAATAALLNGCAGAADQLQDGHRLARGHPASHVVPAALAVAEEGDCSGAELLAAVLAGYEVGVRIGMAMGGTPDGVHDIGTWGSVAAAVAVARLLAPGDPAAARRAIELAAAAVLLTDARTVFAGRTGGHAFLGSSVQLGAGLGAAAAAGLEPAEGSLERHLAALTARDWCPARLSDGVIDGREPGWSRYEICDGYVKVHPTCAHLHGVNDAVEDLLTRGPLDPADVAQVQVRTFHAAAALSAVADDELSARFSLPTSVALAVVTGRLDETSLRTGTVRSPRVRALAERVCVVHDPAMDAGYPAGRPAWVRVLFGDGTERVAEAGRPRGDADRGLSRAALRDKAHRLLTCRFAAGGADVLAAVHDLSAGGTARELGARLRAAAAAKTGSSS